MVNYHALRLFFLKQGGSVLHNKVDDANLNTSCFISSGRKEDEATIQHAFECVIFEDVLGAVSDKRLKRFPNCVLAFDDLISFGPGDFYRLQQRIGSFAYPSIRDVNMVLKVSNWVSLKEMYVVCHLTQFGNPYRIQTFISSFERQFYTVFWQQILI